MNRTIGQKILWGRLKKSLGRGKLARLSGIDAQRISDIEHEHVKPTEAETIALFNVIDQSKASDVWRNYATHYQGAKS